MSQIQPKLPQNPAKQSLTLRVKVLPQARHSAIIAQLTDGTLKICVAAPARNNAANQELCKFLAKKFQIREVKILQGHSSLLKLIRLIP